MQHPSSRMLLGIHSGSNCKAETDEAVSGLLNSRPKGVLAGRPAKSGRKWPKVAESGQKWPKLNKAILKPLNHINNVHNVTITYDTIIILIMVQYYFPQTPGRLPMNTKLFNYYFSDIIIHCTS